QNRIQAETWTYDSQNTAHKQLLLMSSLRIVDLANAIKDNRLASRKVADHIEMLQQQLDSASVFLQRTNDRIELARKQLGDIRQSQLPEEKRPQLEAAMQKLLGVLAEQKQLRERYVNVYEQMQDRMTAALETKNELGQKLAAELESLKTALLFKRLNTFQDVSGKAFLEDIRFFFNRVESIFRPATWIALWEQIKTSGFEFWIVFLAALAMIVLLPGRCRHFLRRIEERYDETQRHYRRMIVFLLRRTLVHTGLTLLFGVYSSLQFSLIDIGLPRFLFLSLLVVLVTRWGMDFLENGLPGQPTRLQRFVSLHLKRFFKIFRVVVIVILAMLLVAGRDNILPRMSWLLFSAALLASAVVFWRKMKTILAERARDGQSIPVPRKTALIKWWVYIFFGGTLILNLLGYGILADQWFRAWTQTVVLMFWAWLGLNGIREWRRDFRAQMDAVEAEKPTAGADHWRWSLIQVARTVWLIVLAGGILWIWDPSGFIWPKLRHFFGATLSVGSLNLSINGIVLATVVIFITHLAVRIGRRSLKEKILDKRPLEPGLKDSILTITSYLGWGLGLILALGVVGVNATSLAVIFGALSIGIGFGLQNIFNNFISGLILLFERPIQVGDYVEVGGLWAEVKKINVRATVVQTFDNASVIIPNAEFISQQVTNWSFKDKRMRRNIEIGVAYGSDIDLVEKTLLEIAQTIPNVLKFPRPDVLFIDHADSALVFRLRIWANVDDYWTVPSRIRHDIDRRFRELDIEIAFPQRDIHIRTMPRETARVDSVGSSSPTPPIEQES
ncbi:MAG TPA: mechanosensitive ion channel domain-containing protein, partial [Desulfobacterales bacterium]